jgi:hypothetical protein
VAVARRLSRLPPGVRVADERSPGACTALPVVAGVASRVAAIGALALLAGCRARELAPSIWPPRDFQCEVEELALRDGALQVLRRVRFDVDGLVVYGTSSRSCTAPGADVALPVFDRLAIYQLVPACIRRFARRIEELGVRRIDTAQGERGAGDDTGLVLRWRAFGAQRTLTARGRVHGPMAAILEVVASHLPPGERFELPEFPARPVVPVLRGVPEPLADAKASLAAYQQLLDGDPDDRAWLLEAFALACDTGRRDVAEQLLERWQATAAPPPVEPFADAPTDGLRADDLRRLLPPQ